MKNCKTFYDTQTAIRLQEIIQPSPNPPPSDKMLLIFGKTFSYGDIQKYTDICFQSTSKMYFMSAGKSLKSEMFLAVLREHIIFNVN